MQRLSNTTYKVYNYEAPIGHAAVGCVDRFCSHFKADSKKVTLNLILKSLLNLLLYLYN